MPKARRPKPPAAPTASPGSDKAGVPGPGQQAAATPPVDHDPKQAPPGIRTSRSAIERTRLAALTPRLQPHAAAIMAATTRNALAGGDTSRRDLALAGGGMQGAVVPYGYKEQVEAGEEDFTAELGGTGLKGAEPYNGWLYEEFLPQLRGLTGARAYREMADNDPMCGGVLFALEMLMRNSQWRVDPANETPEAEEAAQRVEQALFHDLEHPWGQYIDEATSMLTYGYSPHEVIWKVCRGMNLDPKKTSNFSDGLLMPASIPVRSQETLWRWLFDLEGHGNIIGFEQFRIGFPNTVIPRSKMLLNRTVSRRNNPEGRSILRNAYTSYLRKNTILEAEGRLAQRSAGVVRVRIPGIFMEQGADPSMAAVFSSYKKMADSLGQDRQGSTVLPSDKDEQGHYLYDVDYLVADSRKVQEFTPIIDRYDTRIAVSVLADFLMLGTKNVGSFALADSKVSLFVLATDGFNAQIAEVGNEDLLKKVWRLNGLDPAIRPTLKPGQVQKPDLDRISQFVLQISQAGGAIFPSPNGKLEQWLLSLAGAPSTQEQG